MNPVLDQFWLQIFCGVDTGPEDQLIQEVDRSLAGAVWDFTGRTGLQVRFLQQLARYEYIHTVGRPKLIRKLHFEVSYLVS